MLERDAADPHTHLHTARHLCEHIPACTRPPTLCTHAHAIMTLHTVTCTLTLSYIHNPMLLHHLCAHTCSHTRIHFHTRLHIQSRPLIQMCVHPAGVQTRPHARVHTCTHSLSSPCPTPAQGRLRQRLQDRKPRQTGLQGTSGLWWLMAAEALPLPRNGEEETRTGTGLLQLLGFKRQEEPQGGCSMSPVEGGRSPHHTQTRGPRLRVRTR